MEFFESSVFIAGRKERIITLWKDLPGTWTPMKNTLKKLSRLLVFIALMAFLLYTLGQAMITQWQHAEGDLWRYLGSLVKSVLMVAFIWKVLPFVLKTIDPVLIRRHQARLKKQFPDYAGCKPFPDDRDPAVALGKETLFLFRDGEPDTIALAGLSGLEFGRDRHCLFLASRYQDGAGYRYWFPDDCRDWKVVAGFLAQEGLPVSASGFEDAPPSPEQ